MSLSKWIQVITYLAAVLAYALWLADKKWTEEKRTHGNRQFLRLARTFWGILLLALGAGLVYSLVTPEKPPAFATALKEQNEKLIADLNAEKERSARRDNEYREQVQRMLVKLNAAKQEDSKRITEEKIRVIQKDFTEWAERFVSNRPMLASEYTKAKQEQRQQELQAVIDEAKKEVRLTHEALPIISFAKRYVEETARAYDRKAGRPVVIEPAELPENFYEKEIEYPIWITKRVQWRVTFGGQRPAGGKPFAPRFRIVFFDSITNATGQVNIYVDSVHQKLDFNYDSAPVPDPTKINGVIDWTDYETSIRERLQPIIDIQLAHELE